DRSLQVSESRKLLGRNAGLASRQSIYETPDALEIESVEQYEVSCRRVLFEDVLLVTYHRETGWGIVVANLFIFLVFFLISGLIYSGSGAIPATLIAAALGVPSLLLVFIRLILKVDVVSVFGRRSKAVLRYAYRKRRARETYG